MRIKNRHNRITGSKYQRIPKKKVGWLIPEILQDSLREGFFRHRELLMRDGIRIITPPDFYGILPSSIVI